MGSELIAHIRVIQVLPVADNWIDEDGTASVSPHVLTTRHQLAAIAWISQSKTWEYVV